MPIKIFHLRGGKRRDLELSQTLVICKHRVFSESCTPSSCSSVDYTKTLYLVDL